MTLKWDQLAQNLLWMVLWHGILKRCIIMIRTPISEQNVSVAVIIVNYQSDQMLRQCLVCLRDQIRLPDRVVVVDNHEPGHDLDYLRDYGRVEVIRSGSNIGFAAAANLGLAAVADCELVAMLNPDAFPEQAWLANLLNAAAQFPEYGSFSSLMIMADSPEVLDGAGDSLHFSGVPWRVGHGSQRQQFDQSQVGCFSACAGAALYRKSALDDVGGFDESFFMYVEDVDLGFRLQLRGYPCRFVEDAVVLHIGSAISGYRSDFSLYYGHRNLVWSYFKNMPWQLLLLTLPFHIAMNLLTLVVFAWRGNGAVIGRAKLDAIKGLPDVLKRRGKNHARRIPLIQMWKLFDKGLGLREL
jgi:GT2 family glycosyltransferase